MYLSNSTGTFLSLGCDFGEDRISGLPDDITLTFLSPMGMKEAARTSILSKRWRYLWANRTHLDFDPNHLDLDMFDYRGKYIQKGKYINWVNQVVGLHCSPCIDTFRICFRFDSSDTHHFDRWVKFALSRKVKNLELNTCSRGEVYTLGFDILKPSVGIGDSGITSLTSLHLVGVDVSGDFVELLLSKCRYLERLRIELSSLLVRLKVVGLSLKLKQLTIRDCFELEELQIDDVNLTYINLSSWTPSMNLVLKSMPMLVEATFRGSCVVSPVCIFQQISHLAAHLCKLTLDMQGFEFPARASFPIFCNLKHLDMVIDGVQSDSDDVKRFLDACPVLLELKLKVYWWDPSSRDEANMLVEMDELNSNGLEFGADYRLRVIEQNTHSNLTQLKVDGYIGCSYDVDIILTIMACACNLETIICDCCGYNDGDAETSRARAYKLQKIIPPKICVIIL